MSDGPVDAPVGSASPSGDTTNVSDGEADEESDTDGPDEVVDEPPLTVQGELDDQEPRLRRRRHIDQTRAGLAWALVWIFGGTVAAVILIVALTSPHPAAEVTEILKTLVPAETALLGSAVGFYFGTRNR